MKLSIWQQFSSNHSADIEIIAKFKTLKDAEKARNRLEGIMSTIRGAIKKRDARPMKKLEEEYDIQFNQSLLIPDVYPLDTYLQFDHIIVQDTLLVSRHDTEWTSNQQLAKIAKSLGAETVAVGSAMVEISWNFSFDIFDDALADKFEHTFLDAMTVESIYGDEGKRFDERMLRIDHRWGIGYESYPKFIRTNQHFEIQDTYPAARDLPQIIEWLKEISATNIELACVEHPYDNTK